MFQLRTRNSIRGFAGPSVHSTVFVCLGGGFECGQDVRRPCPPIRNNIVTPRHLFIFFLRRHYIVIEARKFNPLNTQFFSSIHQIFRSFTFSSLHYHHHSMCFLLIQNNRCQYKKRMEKKCYKNIDKSFFSYSHVEKS